MARRRLRENDLPLTAEINITSLVDVAFTLLVIFIITAPVLQGGIEVDVPEADVQPITAEDDPFFVTVTRDGGIYIEDAGPLTTQEFRESIGQLLETARPGRVYIRGDSTASWARMIQVMGALTGSGTNWSVVAEPWTGN